MFCRPVTQRAKPSPHKEVFCMTTKLLSAAQRKAVQRPNLMRRGNIIVLSAVLMVVLMTMIALSVDVGYMYTLQAQLQRSVDAAALAGAGELVNGLGQAKDAAKEYLVRNPVGSSTSFVSDNNLAAAQAAFNANHANNYTMTAGTWNPQTHSFSATNSLPSALAVSMQYPNNPFFFARVLGKTTFTVRAESTAQFQPR